MKKSNFWTIPPKIKIYEALGALVDDRLETVTLETTKVWSSDKSKFYTVIYDGSLLVRANDNGSYWQGYLGYPAVAVLMLKGRLKYDPQTANYLKGINWKQINQLFRNQYDQTISFVLESLDKQGLPTNKIQSQVNKVIHQLSQLKLVKHPIKLRPPSSLTDSQRLLDLALVKLKQSRSSSLFPTH